MTTSFWLRAETFPPIFCRLLARHKSGRPLTTEEIAHEEMLDCHLVDSISLSLWWDGISLTDARKFLRGCRTDFESHADMKRVGDYLARNPNFAYLRRSPEWKTYYLPLLTKWRKSYGIVTEASPFWPPVRKLLIRLTPLLHTEIHENQKNRGDLSRPVPHD